MSYRQPHERAFINHRASIVLTRAATCLPCTAVNGSCASYRYAWHCICRSKSHRLTTSKGRRVLYTSRSLCTTCSFTLSADVYYRVSPRLTYDALWSFDGTSSDLDSTTVSSRRQQIVHPFREPALFVSVHSLARLFFICKQAPSLSKLFRRFPIHTALQCVLSPTAR